jgi:glycerol kinase
LGLCSQRSSFLIWERVSGQPLTPLISWQDNRGAASCEILQHSEGLIRDLTGLHLTPYYFAPKLRVVLLDHPDWLARLERGELLAGTLDTFLIWRWTGGKHHVTDASMAARTLLMDIHQQRWSPVLCELFGIPLSILPEIKPSAGMNLPLMMSRREFQTPFGLNLLKPNLILQKHPIYLSTSSGRTDFKHNTGESIGLILQASLGDQSAALIASVGESRSDVLINLGTGGFVARYLAEGASAQEGYLRTLVYQDSKLHTYVAIEGTLNSLAAALAPYPVCECRVEDLAKEDIFCIAEPSGLGAPYFRNDFGIRFSRSPDHLMPRQIACLLLEGIIFRVARILEDFHRATAIERVYLTGGLSELICLQQGITQCAPCDVYRLQQKDSSLQGAALLAAGVMSFRSKKAENGEAEKITITLNNSLLPEKYLRWKDWFNALLDFPDEK